MRSFKAVQGALVGGCVVVGVLVLAGGAWASSPRLEFSLRAPDIEELAPYEGPNVTRVQFDFGDEGRSVTCEQAYVGQAGTLLATIKDTLGEVAPGPPVGCFGAAPLRKWSITPLGFRLLRFRWNGQVTTDGAIEITGPAGGTGSGPCAYNFTHLEASMSFPSFAEEASAGGTATGYLVRKDSRLVTCPAIFTTQWDASVNAPMSSGGATLVAQDFG